MKVTDAAVELTPLAALLMVYSRDLRVPEISRGRPVEREAHEVAKRLGAAGADRNVGGIAQFRAGKGIVVLRQVLRELRADLHEPSANDQSLGQGRLVPEFLLVRLGDLGRSHPLLVEHGGSQGIYEGEEVARIGACAVDHERRTGLGDADLRGMAGRAADGDERHRRRRAGLWPVLSNHQAPREPRVSAGGYGAAR